MLRVTVRRTCWTVVVVVITMVSIMAAIGAAITKVATTTVAIIRMMTIIGTRAADITIAGITMTVATMAAVAAAKVVVDGKVVVGSGNGLGCSGSHKQHSRLVWYGSVWGIVQGMEVNAGLFVWEGVTG
jgi:membrane-bound inhibitor of C-type lysozyme